jgi:hypothetical protein
MRRGKRSHAKAQRRKGKKRRKEDKKRLVESMLFLLSFLCGFAPLREAL